MGSVSWIIFFIIFFPGGRLTKGAVPVIINVSPGKYIKKNREIENVTELLE